MKVHHTLPKIQQTMQKKCHRLNRKMVRITISWVSSLYKRSITLLRGLTRTKNIFSMLHTWFYVKFEIYNEILNHIKVWDFSFFQFIWCKLITISYQKWLWLQNIQINVDWHILRKWQRFNAIHCSTTSTKHELDFFFFALDWFLQSGIVYLMPVIFWHCRHQ